jgi:hypothetical protein
MQQRGAYYGFEGLFVTWQTWYYNGSGAGVAQSV